MKIAKTDLAWLAGVMDSDGSIGLYKYSTTNGYGTAVIRGMVTIVNTNKLMIDRVCDIYDQYNVGYYIGTPKKTKGWKQAYSVVVQNREGIATILNAILPYMVVKLKQAEICLEFVSREKFSKISQLDNNLLDCIKLLNKRGSNV